MNSCPAITAAGLPSGATGTVGASSLSGSTCTALLTVATSPATTSFPFTVLGNGIHGQTAAVTISPQVLTSVTLTSLQSTSVPGSNTGGYWTVTLAYANAFGAADILGGQFFVGPNPAASTTNGCYVQWNSAGGLTLVDPSGATHAAQAGRGSTVQGTFCALLPQAAAVAPVSGGYSVTIEVWLPANYAGPYSVWASGTSGFLIGGAPASSLIAPWTTFSDFSLTASPPAISITSNTAPLAYTVGVSPMNGFTQGINPNLAIACTK